MLESDLMNLNNQELIELLATLEGLDDVLKENEKMLKEYGDENENKL